jgi:nitrite reductase/ring-hydroxylating ferredoxin subunit
MRLCHLSDLPESGSRGFDPEGSGQSTLFIVRQGERLFAYADACPHLDTPLAWRRHAYLNAAGDHIVCAAHGALFEISTGLCTLGPCLGESLRPLPVTTHANGEVHLAEGALQETKK